MSTAVAAVFWVSFLIAAGTLVYAVWTARRIEVGELRQSVVYAALASTVFGVHHLGELYLAEVPLGRPASESVEILAIVGFGAVMLSFYNYAMANVGVGASAD